MNFKSAACYSIMLLSLITTSSQSNAGIDLGNHGSKIREDFTTARSIAIDLMNGYSTNQSLTAGEKKSVELTLSELSKIRFIWQSDLPNGQCAQTEPFQGADIHFSFISCGKEITSLLAAAKLLIGMTSLHLSIDQLPPNFNDIEKHWQRTFPAIYRQLSEVFSRSKDTESPKAFPQRLPIPVGNYRLQNNSSVIVQISPIGEIEIDGQILDGFYKFSLKVEQLLDWDSENSNFYVNGYAFKDDQATAIPVTVKIIPSQQDLSLELQFSGQTKSLKFIIERLKATE